LISIASLASFLELQNNDSRLIALPVQWIWLSLLPIFLALVAGGYIKKLKAPGFEFEPGLQNLPYYPPTPASQSGPSSSGVVPYDLLTELDAGTVEKVFGKASTFEPEKAVFFTEGQPRANWTQKRSEEYLQTHGLFLVHVCKPSTIQGQRYDVRIFIIRHIPGSQPNQKEGFQDIDTADFYFGRSWGDRVFTAKNEGSFIGVSTAAWGTFLAICRVTFKDRARAPVILYRYVDFEMAPTPP